jgi:nucleotide-binding universal stress UspA family protein
MALRDVLVHVDGTENGAACVELAVNIAAQHRAHLTGLFVRDTLVTAPSASALGFSNWQLAEALMQQIANEMRSAADSAQAAFTDRAARDEVGYEWREADGITAEMLTLHARYADLCIIRQPRPGAAEEGGYLDLAETLLFGSGRPVLVHSFAADPARPLNTVLVAGSGAREAARAVNDALPFLTSAKTVLVLAVNTGEGLRGEEDLPAADMAAHLARHGVNATALHTVATEIDVGNVLLNEISDRGADLLVMGAYDHSPAREMILGGATRVVLRHMTVPVLMSH